MKRIDGFWLSPTYACNNRCRHCYAGGKLSLNLHTPLSQLQHYVDLLVQSGAKSCILVGGEPSVYPEILPLVQYMTMQKLDVRIMSNGRALANLHFVRQLVDAGLKYCAVSIEGTESVHDFITRVPGSFAEAMQGLENCKICGLGVNSITTVSSYNLDCIDAITETLHERGVPIATFNMCSAQPSGYQQDTHVGQIQLEQYARVVERLSAKYDFVRFYALIPLCIFDQALLPGLIASGKLRVACSLYSRAVAVDPKGNLLPCTHMADLSYGNLNEKGTIPLFLKRKTKEKSFLQSHAPSEKCIDCKLWTTCHGGCNLIWFARDARTAIPGLINTHDGKEVTKT